MSINYITSKAITLTAAKSAVGFPRSQLNGIVPPINTFNPFGFSISIFLKIS